MATAEMTAGGASIAPSHWWIVLLEGIAALIVGILLVTDPGTTLLSLMIFLGIWWFVGGILELVRLFVDRTAWGWHLFSGILGILAGLALVRHPLWSALLVPASLVWILGGIGLVLGAVGIYQAIFKDEGWGTGILGAMSIIFGLLLLGANPFVSTAVLTWLAAGCGIVGGIIAIIYSFRLRSAA